MSDLVQKLARDLAQHRAREALLRLGVHRDRADAHAGDVVDCLEVVPSEVHLFEDITSVAAITARLKQHDAAVMLGIPDREQRRKPDPLRQEIGVPRGVDFDRYCELRKKGLNPVEVDADGYIVMTRTP